MNTTNNTTNNTTILGGVIMNNTVNNTNNNTILGGMNMNNTTVATVEGLVLRGDVNMNEVNFIEMNQARTVGAYALSKEIALLNPQVGLSAKEAEDFRHLYTSSVKYTIIDVIVGRTKTTEEETGRLFTESRTISLSENRAFATQGTRAAVVALNTMDIVKSEFIRHKDNFIDKFMQFTFKDEVIANNFNIDSFRVFRDSADGSIYLKERANSYRNVSSDTVVSELPKTCSMYKMLLSTAGDSKMNRGLFFRVDYKWETRFTWMEIVNPGSVSTGVIKKERAAKLFAYEAMIKTAGKLSYRLGNAIILHTIALDRTGASDGQFVTNALFVRDTHALKSEVDAVGTAMQLRLGSAQKGTNKVVFSDEFEYMLRDVLDRINVTRLTKVDAGNNCTQYFDGKTLVATVIGQLDKVDFIFDKNTTKLAVDYSYDVNRGMTVMAMAHLSEGKLNSQVNESLVYEAARKDYLARKNGQTPTHMAALEAFYKENAEESISDLFADILYAEEKMPGLESDYALDVLAAVRPDHNIVAHSKLNNGINTLMNSITGLSFATKTNGEVDCFNFLLQSDFVAMFGAYRVLDDNTVFNAHFARKIERAKEYALDMQDMFGADAEITIDAVENYLEVKEQCSRIVLTKAPKMGVGEYFNAKLADYDDIRKALAKLNAPEVLKAMLMRDFKYSPDGVIYFPANSDRYKKLAGSDNDGDKVQGYTNKFIVELLDRDVTVYIDAAVKRNNGTKTMATGVAAKLAAKGNGKKALYNADGKLAEAMLDLSKEEAIIEVFMTNVKNEMSIGVITFYNNKVVAALTMAYLGDFTMARKILEEVGITEGTEDRSLNVDDTEVTVNFADELKEDMGKVIWTEDNLIDFLEALNKIFRLYQEGAIDASKTGVFLKIIFKVDSIVIQRLLGFEAAGFGMDKTIVRVEDKRLGFDATIRDEDGNFVKKMPKTFIIDPMAKIENTLVELANESVAQFRADYVDRLSYSDTDVVYFLDTLKKVQQFYPEVLRELYVAKDVYKREVGCKAVELSKLEKDDNFGAQAVSEKYRNIFESLSNHVRKILAKLDLSAFTQAQADLFKAELLLGVGAGYKFDVVDATSGNKFAYVVAPEYAYAYFTGGVNYTAGARIVNANFANDGDSLTLSRGINSDTGLLVQGRYTGEVVVTDGMAVAQKSFERKVERDTEAMIVINKDITKELTTSSTLAYDADGLWIAYNLNKSKDMVNVEAAVKSFSGIANDEYYVDSFDTVGIRTKTGKLANGQDKYEYVTHTVMFLTRINK